MSAMSYAKMLPKVQLDILRRRNEADARWREPTEGERLASCVTSSTSNSPDNRSSIPSTRVKWWRRWTEPCVRLSGKAGIESFRDEWKEWETWSSCQLVELREGEVDPSLILKSRVCYRWKPKGSDSHPRISRSTSAFADKRFTRVIANLLHIDHTMVSISWSQPLRCWLKSAFLQGLPDVERPNCHLHASTTGCLFAWSQALYNGIQEVC